MTFCTICVRHILFQWYCSIIFHSHETRWMSTSSQLCRCPHYLKSAVFEIILCWSGWMVWFPIAFFFFLACYTSIGFFPEGPIFENFVGLMGWVNHTSLWTGNWSVTGFKWWWLLSIQSCFLSFILPLHKIMPYRLKWPFQKSYQAPSCLLIFLLISIFKPLDLADVSNL